MKRPKRAIPTEKTFVNSIFSVKCPHCKTKLTGGICQYVDRMFCYHCGNIIMLDWQVMVKKKET